MAEIDINIKTPKEKGPQAPPPRRDFPQIIEDETPVVLPVEISFFDAGTKPSATSGEYDDVDGLTPQEITEQWSWSDTSSFKEDSPFHLLPKHVSIKVYGGDESGVADSVWSEEYSSDKSDRWDRKPLLSPTKSSRTGDNQRSLGGVYMLSGDGTIYKDYAVHCVRVELHTKIGQENPVARISPDMFYDGDAKKLRVKFPEHRAALKPLVFKGRLGRRTGIKVQEVGTKSFAHYSSGPGSYAYEWLEGIYFNWFDTLDTDNFKVTREPDYSADEVSGKVVSKGDVRIGLVPRRWAYYVRYRHQENKTGTTNSNVYSSINCACDDELELWNGWSDEAVDINYTRSTTCDADPPVQSADSSLTARECESTHYIGVMWGRPPNQFKPSNLGLGTVLEDVATVNFCNGSGTSVGTQDFIWCPTKDQAKAQFLAAGGDSGDAEFIHEGGSNADIHVHRDGSSDYVKIGNSTSYGHLDAFKNQMFLGPIVAEPVYSGAVFTIDDDALGIKRLWQVIEDSPFWEDVIEPLRNDAVAMTGDHSAASRIDMIPFGIGISPTKEGELVGIVKTGAKVFFVWRKTDEDLDDLMMRNGTAAHLSFESRNTNGRLEHYGEGDFEDNWGAQDVEDLYDAEYADQFSGDGSRKLTAVGRVISWNSGSGVSGDCSGTINKGYASCSGNGHVDLDVPVYVMASKERAFDDISWDSSFDGANRNLRQRIGRFNGVVNLSADTRNAY